MTIAFSTTRNELEEAQKKLPLIRGARMWGGKDGVIKQHLDYMPRSFHTTRQPVVCAAQSAISMNYAKFFWLKLAQLVAATRATGRSPSDGAIGLQGRGQHIGLPF